MILIHNLYNFRWLFQQDGAPPHTADQTREWLRTNLSSFWDKHLWPPNSPDLNPLDYGIWGVMESKACATPHPNLDSLRSSVAREWDNLSAEYVAKTCKSFRARLEKVVAAKGGYIEK